MHAVLRLLLDDFIPKGKICLKLRGVGGLRGCCSSKMSRSHASFSYIWLVLEPPNSREHLLRENVLIWTPVSPKRGKLFTKRQSLLTQPESQYSFKQGRIAQMSSSLDSPTRPFNEALSCFVASWMQPNEPASSYRCGRPAVILDEQPSVLERPACSRGAPIWLYLGCLLSRVYFKCMLNVSAVNDCNAFFKCHAVLSISCS